MEITSTFFFFLVFPTSLLLILLTKYMDSTPIIFPTIIPKEPIPTNTPYFSLSDYEWNVNIFFKNLIQS